VFATEDFAYVHVEKTGGNYVRKVFEPEIVFERIHCPWERAPADVKRLPAFCTIRNPWAWYVSWYHFALEARTNDERFGLLARRGRAPFEEFVWRAFDNPKGDLYTRSLRATCHWGLVRDEVTPLRLERLRDELGSFLRRVGHPVPELPSKRENASDHGPYRDYYDDELRELVATCPIVERFGYEF
jgi:hypothetical protein